MRFGCHPPCLRVSFSPVMAAGLIRESERTLEGLEQEKRICKQGRCPTFDSCKQCQCIYICKLASRATVIQSAHLRLLGLALKPRTARFAFWLASGNVILFPPPCGRLSCVLAARCGRNR